MMKGVKYTSNASQVTAKLENAEKATLEALGRAGVGFVKLNTAVDTGALRDSIDFQVDDKGVLVGSTLTSEDYPIYIEKGTSRMPAQPYISTGIMGNASALRQIAQGSFKL